MPYFQQSLFVHGTSLATNAMPGRRGAGDFLIAPAGLRDMPEIAIEPASLGHRRAMP